jgi:hypothetical protein
MTTEEIIEMANASPALDLQSSRKGIFAYPEHWEGKVPLKVKMLIRVHPDMPFLCKSDTEALEGKEYYVWVNSYGAVSAILPNEERLGLKPDEFEIIEWHQ